MVRDGGERAQHRSQEHHLQDVGAEAHAGGWARPISRTQEEKAMGFVYLMSVAHAANGGGFLGGPPLHPHEPHLVFVSRTGSQKPPVGFGCRSVPDVGRTPPPQWSRVATALRPHAQRTMIGSILSNTCLSPPLNPHLPSCSLRPIHDALVPCLLSDPTISAPISRGVLSYPVPALSSPVLCWTHRTSTSGRSTTCTRISTWC